MVCDAMMFFLCQFYYPEDAKSYNVPLKILWGEMYPKQLDNPNNVQGKKNQLISSGISICLWTLF